MIIKGLTATLEPEPDVEVVGSAATGAEALRRFREAKPDVTIMDITMSPDMNGIEAAGAIRREFPNARLIMLTVHREEDKIYRALEAGAMTYVLKETLLPRHGSRLGLFLRLLNGRGRRIQNEIAGTLRVAR
jgi:DNA-binding NarL/FixJ family response regulator